MAKRFGRTIISSHGAAAHRYQAKLVGALEAPLAGNCQRPVTLGVTGLPDRLTSRLNDWRETDVDYAPGHGVTGSWREGRPINADIAVRCRKCPACLHARARHWRLRCRAELEFWPRTWFSTFTLSPENHWKHEAAVLAYLDSRGVEPKELQARDPDEWFRQRCKPLVVEMQKYLKRIRKEAGRLRCVYVIEKHKSGLPHLHAFIHEAPDLVRHRVLTDQWGLGFSSHKLVPRDEGGKAAYYLCKYLTKDLANRARASTRYGAPLATILPKSPPPEG